MRREDIRIQVYGLEDPDDDLTLVSHCEVCGVELWRATYRQRDYQCMPGSQIAARIQNDVTLHATIHLNHECVLH